MNSLLQIVERRRTVQPDQLARNVQAQEALYGAPLGEHFRRLVATFSLTQAQLAATIGVSAPMLSQLMSGQRVKIGNPAVVQRVTALSDLADDVDAGRLSPAEAADRLAEVRGFSGALTRSTRHAAAPDSGAGEGDTSVVDVVEAVRGLLRAVASGQELLDVAADIAPTHPALAELLRVYGTGKSAGAVEHFKRHEHLL